ncbi:50S ribosomal protein L29 [Candidatus Shapirobacteria bacterium]|nr:50S ribosomal protein L29 [Candidatus Shapirobacteria bacterium]
MKKNQKKELHQKNNEELKQLIGKMNEELVKLKMEKQAGKLKNVRLLERKKHELAIVKTIFKEKELNL